MVTVAFDLVHRAAIARNRGLAGDRPQTNRLVPDCGDRGQSGGHGVDHPDAVALAVPMLLIVSV